MVHSRRRFLAALAAAPALASAGCVATRLRVDADLSGVVFTGVGRDQSVSWGANRVAATVSLAPDAATDRRVREIVVATAGSVTGTRDVRPGQTGVSVFLPVGKESSLLAVDASENVVDTGTVRVRAARTP
ncbi:hypothetical protein [Halobacterium litoreum]|uniref:Tat (Twin-arginine translocation) pathway signal sequence n=1 Tax=Halobacterium litoreum TaxID=2039234 RepID=A0ABD5NF04_9EURY|nr:hypothetical protein [Halobacterium litoreum]UHH13345.1 hypothetical protein LT972_14450 [Halobacterium litoreum]